MGCCVVGVVVRAMSEETIPISTSNDVPAVDAETLDDELLLVLPEGREPYVAELT